MVISFGNGKSFSYFLDNSAIQRAVERTVEWAKKLPPNPAQLNKMKRAQAIAQNPDKVPFCHQYWAKLQQEGKLKPRLHQTVEKHGYFNTFNCAMVKGEAGCWNVNSLQGIIKQSDIEFKSLRPTKQSMTVYRVVGEKPPFFEEDVKYYRRAFQAKKGDVITMPEYAYFAGSRRYSDVYMGHEGRGIIYEMEIPAGARVSHSGNIVDGKLDHWGAECVTPRGSQFEVLETQMLENGSKHIRGRYILPNEPWRSGGAG